MKGDLIGLAKFLEQRVLYFFRLVQENVGKEVLKRSLPQVPVDTGRLAGSGQVWLNGKLFWQPGQGPTIKYYNVNKKIGTITIIYSGTKQAGENARRYFNFGGNKWFDYAEIQHDRFGHNWLGMEMNVLDVILQASIRKAIAKLS